MKISRVMQMVEIFSRAKIPVFIWGPPGAGKSQLVRQLTEIEHFDNGEKNSLFGYKVIDRRLSNFQPSDLKGLPREYKGKLDFLLPEFFPESEESFTNKNEGIDYSIPNDGKIILFLDEFNLANQQVQGASYQIILDRMIDGRHLHDDVYVIAAGNVPPTDDTDAQTIVQDISEALLKRFAHIPLDQDHQEQLKYFGKAGMDSMIVDFFKENHELFKYKTTRLPFSYSEQSGRQVEYVSRTFSKLHESERADANVLANIVSSIMLDRAGSLYAAWVQQKEFAPTGEEICKNGASAENQRMFKKWTETGQLALLNKSYNNVIQYLNKLEDEDNHLYSKLVDEHEKNPYNSMVYHICSGLIVNMPRDMMLKVMKPKGIEPGSSETIVAALLSKFYKNIIEELDARLNGVKQFSI